MLHSFLHCHCQPLCLRTAYELGSCSANLQSALFGAPLQEECNRVRGKPSYRELKGEGPEEAQAAEAATYAREWHDSVVDDVFGGLLQSTLQCTVSDVHTWSP